MNKNKALIVNLFGGPGSGKSTTAAGVFYFLKRQNVNCELVTEYAKTKVWERSFTTLDDQVYVFGKQHHKNFTVADQVDVIITDAPLLLSLYYGSHLTDSFKNLVIDTYNNYKNFNFYIERPDYYDAVGRMQKEHEAKNIDTRVKELLNNYNIDYTLIKADEMTVETIVKQVLNKLVKK